MELYHGQYLEGNSIISSLVVSDLLFITSSRKLSRAVYRDWEGYFGTDQIKKVIGHLLLLERSEDRSGPMPRWIIIMIRDDRFHNLRKSVHQSKSFLPDVKFTLHLDVAPF